MSIRKTEERDIPAIDALYQSAREALRAQGVDQWQQGPYPSGEDARRDMERGEGYVLEEDGKVIAAACLAFGREPTYEVIEGGSWGGDPQIYGYLHRIAVAPEAKGRGAAGKMFDELKRQARERGIAVIRGDTHRDNRPMQRVMAKAGLQYRGIIYLEDGSERLAFEGEVPCGGEGHTLPQIAGPLLRWYDDSARVLPWREEPTPYHVWVSEIMLQQTRVEAAKPYYRRFLAALPTVEDLADAPEELLLKLWEGLGYYNRARNLQKGARQVMERFGGVIPRTVEELRSLSGVGDYTAGAIASIAFGVPAPAVDGNVLRVVSRLLASYEDVNSPQVKDWARRAVAARIPRDRAGDFNQSLMELGALVCLPGGPPRCGECPLQSLCKAHALGVEEELPVKGRARPRKTEDRTVFLLTAGGRLALSRRPEKGLLAGLWELPSVPGALDEPAARDALRALLHLDEALALALLPPARHIFTHLEWRMTGYAVNLPSPPESAGLHWASWEELRAAYPLPSAFKAYLPEIKKRLNG